MPKFFHFSHFLDNPLITVRHLSRIASNAYSKSHRAKPKKTRLYPRDLFGSISIKSQMTLKNVDLHFERLHFLLRYFSLFRLLNRAGLLLGMVFINAENLSMHNGWKFTRWADNIPYLHRTTMVALSDLWIRASLVIQLNQAGHAQGWKNNYRVPPRPFYIRRS